jgi:predicted nucleic acid-binding protein
MAAWVYPAVMVAASVIGNMQSSATAKANAERNSQYAYLNALNTRQYGFNQAALYGVTAQYNANLIMQQAALKSQASSQIAAYNRDLLQQVANFNSLLYSEEIDSLMNALDLDEHVLEVEYAKARGALEAQQAASGVIMGQDSNADVITQVKTDEALEALVLRTNANNRVAEILNASAQGQWQAVMEGQKLMYEAHVSGMTDMLSASMQSRAALFEGAANAVSTMQTSANRAWSALFEADQRSQTYQDTSSYYKTRAITQGAQASTTMLK